MDSTQKKGMTATEQKELRRVFNHLANFLPKQSIYAELNPLVDRSQELAHFLKNPEVLKVHDEDGNEMRSDDVVREQAELQLKIDELRKRIQDYDNSPTSKIHAADLNEAMKLLGRKCTKKEIEDMIWEVDENLDGCVDWEEFKVRTRSLIRSCPPQPPRPPTPHPALPGFVHSHTYAHTNIHTTLQLMFQRNITDTTGLEPFQLFNVVQFMMYDKDNSGKVTVDETMHMLYARYGKARLESQMKALFGEDLKTEDGDGELSFNEYLKAVSIRLPKTKRGGKGGRRK